MSDPTALTITDEQHAIARAYVTQNIDDLLYWVDLDELLEQPFTRPERDHPAESEVCALAMIEGIPLRETLRLDDTALALLARVSAGPGEGAVQLRALLGA